MFERIVACCSAVVLFGGSARADLVMDQSVTGPPDNAFVVSRGTEIAQTFTAGVYGHLAEVDVALQRPDAEPGVNLLFDIRLAPGGVPLPGDAGILAHGSVPLVDTPGFGYAALTGFSVPVAPGDQLAVVLTTDQTSSLGWQFRYGPLYPGGGGFVRSSASADPQWSPYPGDFLFQTKVNTVAMPEPSGLAMMGAGLAPLAGLFGWVRRKTRPTAA